MAVYLSGFRIEDPPFFSSQEESLHWLANCYAKHSSPRTAEEFFHLLKRVAAKAPQIERRGHYLPEFQNQDFTPVIFADAQGEMGAKAQVRMNFFSETGQGIFSRLFSKQKMVDEKVSDLLHVTCTGYISPSPAQQWALSTELHKQIRVQHLYHMGCYAALPAIYQAQALVAQHKRVEICHTELCTLQLNPHDPSLEEMVVHALFADGACAYSARNEPPPNSPSLRLIKSHEEMLPASTSAMTWGLAEWGLAMTLSKDVPGLVKKALSQILQEQLADLVNLQDETLIWAIHPGGPKILDELKESLNLSEKQIGFSRKVLRERGNMSSATLPHIWHEILQDKTLQHGAKILTMAFGPGLTVSLAILELIR